MFDILNNMPPTKAISAAYYAVRLINHRNQLNNIADGCRVGSLKSEPSEEDEHVALSMIREIEASEGVNIQSIEDSSAEQYLIQLSQIAQQRAIAEFGYDADRGRELLGQFEPAISEQARQNSAY